MPAHGRSQPGSSNIIAANLLPSLPVPLYDGKISVSLSFEGHPSGTIEYPSASDEFLVMLDAVYAAPIDNVQGNRGSSSLQFQAALEVMGAGNNISLSTALSSASQALPGSGSANKIVIGEVYLTIATFSYDPDRFEHESGISGRTHNVKVGLAGYHEFAVNKPINLGNLSRANGKIAIATLARAGGIPYSGPNFLFTAEGETTTFASVLQANARRLGCFIDYCGPTVALKAFDGVASWSFSDQELIDEGEIKLEIPPSFRNLEVTGPFLLSANQFTLNDNETANFRQREPVIETIVEEDDDFDDPPEDTLVLRSLDSNFDMSGPKKVRKETTLMDGSAILEETWIKGFAYTSEQIHVGEGLLFSDTPKDYWTLVEYQRSEPIYEKLPSLVSIEISARDPITQAYIPLLLHPDYVNFASVRSFGSTNLSLSLNTEFLTLNKISGWILNRLLKENGSTADGRAVGNTLDGPDNPFYPYMHFKREPKQDQTAYRLKSVREKYGDDTGLPFSIEWVEQEALDPRLRDRVSPNYDGRVGVITPDLNFVEPLYVETESRKAGSFTWAVDPESSPPDFQPTPLLTGEESYSRSDRTILSSNKYREKVSEASAKDSNFGSFVESVRFREQLGRPPDASHRQKPWEKADDTPQSDKQPETAIRYFLTSDLLNDKTPIGGSINYPNAASLAEARKNAEMDLRIAGLQTAQAGKKVSWYYPQIRPGDIIYAGTERFTTGRGFWRSLSVSWEQEYKGRNNSLGLDPLVTCPGTQLSLGLDRKRKVTLSSKASRLPETNAGDPEVTVRASFGNHSLGKILKNTSNRRNF